MQYLPFGHEGKLSGGCFVGPVWTGLGRTVGVHDATAELTRVAVELGKGVALGATETLGVAVATGGDTVAGVGSVSVGLRAVVTGVAPPSLAEQAVNAKPESPRVAR